MDVAVDGTGVDVVAGGDAPQATKSSRTNIKPIICGNNLL
jgi:hypothetical protein